jgi:hypothetical protein
MKLKKNYIIASDLKSFFCLIPMKIQALVLWCDEFLHTCIVEIFRQSIEPVFDRLHFITAHVHASQKLLQMWETSENHLDPGLYSREDEKKCPRQSQHMCANSLYFLDDPCSKLWLLIQVIDWTGRIQLPKEIRTVSFLEHSLPMAKNLAP